jgi:hypothetical protein
MRPGGSHPRFVPVPDMARRKQRDDPHPGRGAGRDSERVILDDQASRRRQPERGRHHPIDVRMRLAAFDAGGAEHAIAEMAAKAQPLQRGVEPRLVARRGDGEPTAGLRLQEWTDSFDRRHVRDSRRHPPVDALPKGGQVDGEAAVRLDGAVAVAPAQSRIALDRLLGGDAMAKPGQDFRKRRIGDDFAVDDDSVKVEDDRIEIQRRSPNRAVPTRTWVAPTATAVSKSADMPMERLARPCRRASLASSAK